MGGVEGAVTSSAAVILPMLLIGIVSLAILRINEKKMA